jgi:hypothetical protein
MPHQVGAANKTIWVPDKKIKRKIMKQISKVFESEKKLDSQKKAFKLQI